MPAREPSPALSENAIDITGGLLGGDSDPDSVKGLNAKRPGPSKQNGELQELDSESGSDDAEHISILHAERNRKGENLKGRTVKKGGGFQAMGLNALLLKAITKKGFSVPTPIQRKTIPLITEGRDVVGMARTGSGKTAAFVIPMIEKLKVHSAKVGSRALILSPSRELALQTLKVAKELGKGTDLKCALFVGGDSLEQQFSDMVGNPDIIIATPGRFQHLKVEMSLDLSTMQYVVFDEADRLFEMGFAPQLHDILHSLPPTRQTLLFSATLPSSLVEFTKAGLQDPKMVYLDIEQKMSPDLEVAFFSVKGADKEGALLHIIHDLIKIPTGPTEAATKAKSKEQASNGKKRKRDHEIVKPNELPTEYSTIIFTATKHHVAYLSALLKEAGFAVSYVYGDLDQIARKIETQSFRLGHTHILVCTDVAARGIDIPILANVINYDFPSQPKIFVHRVGRTARAGQRGWSYSLVRHSDAPYLLDLQLFLARRLLCGRQGVGTVNYAEDIAVGSLPRDSVSTHAEWVVKMLEDDIDMSNMRNVATKGESLYTKKRNKASAESAKRASELTNSNEWSELHPLFDDDTTNAEMEREKMLASISGFRPSETVFEAGKRGHLDEAGEVVKKQREKIKAKRRILDAASEETGSVEVTETAMTEEPQVAALDDESDEIVLSESEESEGSEEEEMEIVMTKPVDVKSRNTARDDSVYMGYRPTTINEHEDRAYGVKSGANERSFLTEARSAAMDLANDEGEKSFGISGGSAQRWDKQKKKFVRVANDVDGSKGLRMIRSESGSKIDASLKSGHINKWMRSNRMERLPRVGEAEGKIRAPGSLNGKRWRHKAEKTPRAPDKARDDYYKQKKKFDAAKEKRMGEFKAGEGKDELKGARDVQKARVAKEKRRAKTSRPSKKNKR